jgi:hypothetical protein
MLTHKKVGCWGMVAGHQTHDFQEKCPRCKNTLFNEDVTECWPFADLISKVRVDRRLGNSPEFIREIANY